MKHIKVAMFLLLAGVAVAGAAFTTNSANRFTTENYNFTAMPAFEIGISDKDFLDDAAKFGSSASATGGSTYLSYVSAAHTTGTVLKQDVLNELRSKYIALGETFTDSQSWNVTINGIPVTMTVYLKN